jgi:hypothetical protein
MHSLSPFSYIAHGVSTASALRANSDIQNGEASANQVLRQRSAGAGGFKF